MKLFFGGIENLSFFFIGLNGDLHDLTTQSEDFPSVEKVGLGYSFRRRFIGNIFKIIGNIVTKREI